MLIIVLGGLVLLGSVAILVVCSGINDYIEAPLQPRVGVSRCDTVNAELALTGSRDIAA